MRAFLWISAVVAVLLVVALFHQGTHYPLEFVVTLLLGWVRFLALVIPEMRLDVSSSITALVCLALLAVGLHGFCGWLYRHKKAEQSADRAPRRWRWRWTLALLGVMVLMFVAGISAVGIAHQTTWLATSPEPLLGPNETWVARNEATFNLKQVGIGIYSYHDSRKGFPPGVTFDEAGHELHSWQTLILPYVGYIAREIDLEIPWNHPKNGPIFKNVIPEYWYPGSDLTHDAEGYAVSHYASNLHVISGSKSLKLEEITDGLENTLLIGQAIDNLKPWGQPINWRDPALGINQSPKGFGNPARTGALLLFADGHVKFLGNDTSPAVLKALGTPNAGD